MKNYCDICCKQILNDYSYQCHLKGKKHLKHAQLRHQREEFKKRILECSIYVPFSPDSISPNELIPFFQQYGSIQKHIIGSHYAIIEFDSSEPVDYLLNNQILIRNEKLNIKKRILYNLEFSPTTEAVDVINFDFIKSKFLHEATFDKQLAAFLNAVQLTDIEVQTRYDPICLHLNDIFASVFPNSRVYKFGSSMTGLGFKNCDLDIYMNIGKPILSTPKGKDPIQTPDKSSDVLAMEDLFKKVKKIMYRMRTVFTKIRPVLAAKTPIIKFDYSPTNVSCDISFKHGTGIYKSLLTKHCLSLDNRIKPLMILIKYWARQCEISDSGKISSYAIVLLVIFYLQQPEPGILPPLMEFQKTCAPVIYNGWQINFDENTVLPPITNKSSIPELLQGFFEFYSNTDFSKSVICPLDGQIHTKKEFKETKTLPSCMARYKEIAETEDLKFNIGTMSKMCIQDPIELNYNIMSSTSSHKINLFYYNCKVSADICIEARTNDYKDLLEALFSCVGQPKQLIKFTINGARYLNLDLPHDLPNCENIADKHKHMKDKLFFTIFNIIKDVLERVYNLNVEVLSADNETKQQKIEALSDIHTKKHQELLFHCKGNTNIWYNREKKLNILDPSMTALEKEEAITNEMLKIYKKEDNSRKITLDFICKLQKDYNTMKVSMLITDNKSLKKEFNYMNSSMLGKLPKIVQMTLSHMKRSKYL